MIPGKGRRCLFGLLCGGILFGFCAVGLGDETLFDGETFNGWEGPLESFRIEDGAVVGGSLVNPIPKNQFLSTKASYSDFELSLQFKLIGERANAGVQIRSERIPDHHEMIGYQADLGEGYWGSLYDESRRRKVLAKADAQLISRILKEGGWNDYRIRCQGRRIQLWINGHPTVDYVEPDPSIPLTGKIALQIHSGPPAEAWYRHVKLRELPRSSSALEPGIRGVVPRAPETGVTMDGDLGEFARAFCTPVNHFHADVNERAAQFFYMWDDEAFYAGLRTLDTKPANHAPDDRLWEGDGVEWYFDTRRGEDFRNREWGPGSVHCYWVGLTGTEIAPRFCLRTGYLDSISKVGVEVASRRTSFGLEVEFKLPWANFPQFTPESGAVIGLDAELCYSDGGPRVDRTFAFGSPLSVQQPANLARVQLVDSLQAVHLAASGPVMFPIRADVAWAQPTKPRVTALMGLPPDMPVRMGNILFRLTDLNGSTIGEFPGRVEAIGSAGGFSRATASWSADLSPAGGYHLTGIVYDTAGHEVARIAPRMVSVGMKPGY